MSEQTLKVPSLSDGVVTLRAHRADDLQRSWEQCQDPDSIQWTTVPVPYSPADAAEFLAAMPGLWERDAEWIFAVEFADQYAGTVSLRNEGSGRAEIAFGSHPSVRGVQIDGASVMERALRLLLNWGFAARRLDTVIWWANVGNWASRKLAWKLGFGFSGVVPAWLPHRGELRDAWVGALRRSDPMRPSTTWLEVPLLVGDGATAGCVLRPFRDDDRDRIVSGTADADTQFQLAFVPRAPGPEYGEAYLQQVREEYATASNLRWAVAASADGTLLGTAGLFRIQLGRSAEVGYWIHPDARGQGLAQTASRLAIGYAFGELGLSRVEAYAAATNAASVRVLEGIGMRRTGLSRLSARTGDGAPVDLVGFDILPGELS